MDALLPLPVKAAAVLECVVGWQVHAYRCKRNLHATFWINECKQRRACVVIGHLGRFKVAHCEASIFQNLYIALEMRM